MEEFKSNGMLALPFIYPHEALFQSVNVISTNNETRLPSDFHIFAAPERPWLATAELAGIGGRRQGEKGGGRRSEEGARTACNAVSAVVTSYARSQVCGGPQSRLNDGLDDSFLPRSGCKAFLVLTP